MANKKTNTINVASKGPNKTRAMIGEIATRARSIDFFFFGGFLPNPDPVLKKMGKDQLVYEDIRGDGHLSGVIATRTSGVKRLLWALDRGKTAQTPAAKVAEAVLKQLEMDQIITEILEANYRGYQPMEVIWEQPNADGMILPSAVVGKPPEWFHFGEVNELKFRTMDNFNGEDVPPRKFLLPRRLATFKNPYGEALLSKCYWPAVFKRSGVKFWVTFAEKFGIPFAVGKLPRGAGEKEYEELADKLDAMVQDAVIAIPDDSSVEILEVGKSATGGGEIFQKLIAWADAEMSKAIIGHSAGADATPGKLGGEDSAQDVKEYLVLEDKRLVEATINQLIKWICEVNFGIGDVPVFSMYEEEDVDLDQATRDKTLSDQGVQLSQAYYERTYGFQQGDIVAVGKPAPAAGPDGLPLPKKPSQGPAFSEKNKPIPTPDQAALDTFADGLDPKELQSQADGVLKPIVAMVNSAWSYEDILENLATTFSDLDSKSLQKMLQRAIFVAELLGRGSNAG